MGSIAPYWKSSKKHRRRSAAVASEIFSGQARFGARGAVVVCDRRCAIERQDFVARRDVRCFEKEPIKRILSAIRASWILDRRARSRAAICTSRVACRRACARRTIRASRIDNFRRRGGRSRDRNIRARRRRRWGAGPGGAVRPGRVSRRRARARRTVSACRVDDLRRGGCRPRAWNIRARVRG